MNLETKNKLHELLTEKFSLDELNSLCFNLGIEYEELAGEGRSGKVRELISYMDRRNRLPDLVVTAERLRPQVDFSSVKETNEKRPLTNITGNVKEMLSLPDVKPLRVVFIYHPEERLLADEILDELITGGHKLIFAPFGLPVGSDALKDAVKSDIETADFALLIQTRKSFYDEWVKWRVDLAISSDCKLIPDGIWGYGAEDWFAEHALQFMPFVPGQDNTSFFYHLLSEFEQVQ